MIEGLTQEVLELGQHAQRVRGAIEDAHRQLPSRIEGRDATGAVLVALGADGLPTSFDVDEDWRRLLRSSTVARAVEQALADASQRRMVSWVQAFDAVDWEPEHDVGRSPTSALAADIGAQPTDSTRGPSRDVGQLMRDLLDATDDLDAFSAAATASGVGTAASGRVELRISATNPASCSVDQSWALDKTGSELGAVLGAALEAAREDLARGNAAGPAGRLAGILHDAQAMLRDQNA